ncbi:hypothetical protein ACJIZ3_008210 [Penstemon smallii]|uniref:Aminopeptidase N n=1 Tax=Penstemon smallii TaxID=265156 RepID=A0ABD3T971_9LAMI
MQFFKSTMDTPKEIFLKDYKQPDYFFDNVYLKFTLGEEKTIVSSKIVVSPRLEGSSSPLVLDGADLKVISLHVNGKELKNDDFRVDSRHLTLTSPPSEKFTLEIVTEIYPQANTSMEGLYKSSGNFCTQCEAEGFRKITFYQDRPDIMAKYTCRIEADKSLYPVLLSNGNLIEQGDLEGGKHYVIWEDPHVKPCYLFALVAGKLESRDDTFVTRSGRKVALRIWTPAQDLPKTAHAMGAMENKSLNIFSSKIVLASPETATDEDYAAILGAIGHEYAHNWTGNRVTCRDWFQLSLKEGLTVFRAQEFSSDMGSPTVKRISDVTKLRIYQFPQDAGPMAHPVRPHSYIKIDNFYTGNCRSTKNDFIRTFFYQGAEVVRMYKTLLGTSGFRKGMDLYFKRHDGQAVTCEDFFAAMRDANGADFSNFLLWYSQAGTPRLKVTSTYNAEAKTYSLKFSQEVPATPGQPVKEPMFIPVALGLLGSNGNDIPINSAYHDGKLEIITSNGQPGHTTILRVTKKEEEFVFNDIPERPVPSILRGYSAPVRMDSDLTDADLYFLLANDCDEFNRSDISKKIDAQLSVRFSAKQTIGPQSEAITLPGEGEIMDMMEVADPDAVHSVRSFICKQLASELKQEFINIVTSNRSSEPYEFDHQNLARRALKNVALAYLGTLEDEAITELALHEYRTATNLTELFAALVALDQIPSKTRDEVLADFYDKWQHDFLVLNKWFALQAMSSVPGNVENVRKLLNHPAFDMRDPNMVHSLIGGFCRSPVNFHSKDGSGYKFLGEMVVQLDKINPQVASRMVSAFSRWKRYDETRQSLAKAQLEMILAANGLSENVYLKFTLGEEKTIVSSKIVVSPRLEGSSSPLVLDGADLKVISLHVNGKELKNDDFRVDSRHLTLTSPPSEKFTLEIDRPDIMAKYTCRIEADKSLYPVLLSNGNLIEQGDLEGGKHYVIWEDPHVKPCYLFALVAGKLESRDDTFVTRSGRKVALRIWTPAQDLPKTAQAIGAMENKSLNIFNSKFVLASPETATDADYAAILGAIGHEYAHNWTGNRVTCRDWFQLSLKEGLTVFRDQEFSSDMGSRTVKRISDVSKLRIYQFPQDAGPMAHPVRPHSYIKIDNFYTGKFMRRLGAEVVRMYKTLLGTSGFRKGMDLYFKRHDGQAVTCEDFFAAMRDANGADFSNFLLWYSQAGTPRLKVTSTYNAEAKTYSLKFSQEVPATPGQPVKEPMFIPVALGLLGSNGNDIPINSAYHDGKLEIITSNGQPGHTTILRVTKKEEEFVFNDIPERPVPSILRGYSAPVRMDSDLTDADLYFLLANDCDEFNRWEAGQILARKLMLSLVSDFRQNKPLVLNQKFLHGVKSILGDSSLDKEFISKAITLPGEGEIMDMMEVADPDAVHSVRSFICKQLASELKQEFINIVTSNRSSEPYEFDHQNLARRALKNVALAYLGTLEDEAITELALHEYRTATNLTELFAALVALDQIPSKTRDEVHSLIGGFCGSPVNFHSKDGSGYKFLGEMVVQLDNINPQVASRMVSAFSRWKRYDETRQSLAKAQLEMILAANGLSENVFEIASKSLAA